MSVESLTQPPALDTKILGELCRQYLEDVAKKAKRDADILALYDYGRIGAPVYLLYEHAIRRWLVYGDKEERVYDIWSRVNGKRKKSSRY